MPRRDRDDLKYPMTEEGHGMSIIEDLIEAEAQYLAAGSTLGTPGKLQQHRGRAVPSKRTRKRIAATPWRARSHNGDPFGVPRVGRRPVRPKK
jgi:hypothetical protein